MAKVGRDLHFRDRNQALADARVFYLALQQGTNLLTEELIHTNSSASHTVTQRLLLSALVGTFLMEELDNVALDILIEAVKDDPALVARLYFAYIVLEALEALTASLGDLLPFA